MKVLFTVQSLGIQILDTQVWVTGKRIVDMGNDHVRNALLWCQMHGNAEKQLSLTPKKCGDFTYFEWVQIFKCEEARIAKCQLEVQKEKILEELKKLNPKKYNKQRVQELENLLQELS